MDERSAADGGGTDSGSSGAGCKFSHSCPFKLGNDNKSYPNESGVRGRKSRKIIHNEKGREKV